jgi:hypothetical protein
VGLVYPYETLRLSFIRSFSVQGFKRPQSVVSCELFVHRFLRIILTPMFRVEPVQLCKRASAPTGCTSANEARTTVLYRQR